MIGKIKIKTIDEDLLKPRPYVFHFDENNKPLFRYGFPIFETNVKAEDLKILVVTSDDGKELPLNENQWRRCFEDNLINKIVDVKIKFSYKITKHYRNGHTYVIKYFNEIPEERIRDIAEEWAEHEDGAGLVHGYTLNYDETPFLSASILFEQMEDKERTLSAMIAVMQEYSIINESSIVKFHEEWWYQNPKQK